MYKGSSIGEDPECSWGLSKTPPIPWAWSCSKSFGWCDWRKCLRYSPTGTWRSFAYVSTIFIYLLKSDDCFSRLMRFSFSQSRMLGFMIQYGKPLQFSCQYDLLEFKVIKEHTPMLLLSELLQVKMEWQLTGKISTVVCIYYITFSYEYSWLCSICWICLWKSCQFMLCWCCISFVFLFFFLYGTQLPIVSQICFYQNIEWNK